jgi:hypothetical protein
MAWGVTLRVIVTVLVVVLSATSVALNGKVLMTGRPATHSP